MTAGFHADPQALSAASKSFSAQVEPINAQATSAEAVRGTAGNCGRAYSAQGSAYHAAMLTFVQTLLTPMATRTTWVADTLASCSANYARQDDDATAGLDSAGQGA